MTLPFDRTEFPTRFGKRLRQWRNLRGMSQVVLAHRAGYVPQTISNLERGFTPPSLIVTFVLAEVLEVHPKVLLFGEED
jgi:transcriptional regulator with XRE-family HTH domain